MYQEGNSHEQNRLSCCIIGCLVRFKAGIRIPASPPPRDEQTLNWTEVGDAVAPGAILLPRWGGARGNPGRRTPISILEKSEYQLVIHSTCGSSSSSVLSLALFITVSSPKHVTPQTIIQTLHRPRATAAHGSLLQLRLCTQRIFEVRAQAMWTTCIRHRSSQRTARDIYIYIYICIYMYTHVIQYDIYYTNYTITCLQQFNIPLYTRTYVYIHTRTYVYICTYVYLSLSLYIYIYIYVHTHASLSIYTYIYIYIYIYIYTYTKAPRWPKAPT